MKFLNYFGAASTDGKYALRNWNKNRMFTDSAAARKSLVMLCLTHQPWL